MRAIHQRPLDRRRSKLTVTAGLRWEYYPLMSRAERGIERLDFVDVQRAARRRRRRAGGSRDQGRARSCSRRGWARPTASTTRRCSAPATASPTTRFPWSRPLRGFYPLTIGYSQRPIDNNFASLRRWRGHSDDSAAGHQLGRDPAAAQRRRRARRTRTTSSAAATQQWNVTVERLLPADISVERRLRRHAHGRRLCRRQNLNYAECGGNAKRSLLRAGGHGRRSSTGRAITQSRYHSLQVAVNRPFKNGLLLKGAYTWSKAMNETDEDGWATLDVEPAVADGAQLRPGRLRPPAQLPDGLRLRAAVREGQPKAVLAHDREELAINGIVSAFSGTPFTIARRQHGAQPAGRVSRRSIRSRSSSASATRGRMRSTTTRRRSCSRATSGATRGAISSAGPASVNLDFAAVPGLPVRPLPRRVPGAGDQRAEPHAMGQPGDRASRIRTS